MGSSAKAVFSVLIEGCLLRLLKWSAFLWKLGCDFFFLLVIIMLLGYDIFGILNFELFSS